MSVFPDLDRQLAIIAAALIDEDGVPYALRIERRQRVIEARLDRMEKAIMADLDQLLADVTDESTKIDGFTAIMEHVKTQLAEALSDTTLPPAVQAKIDEIFAAVEANKAKIVSAINANTPPA